MPKHPGTINLTNFKGLNNVSRPEDLDQSYLTKANNVNINKKGTIAKRQGYTLKVPGDVTSLWSSDNGLGCYCVILGDLYRLLDDYSISLIKSDVGTSPLSFEEVDDIVYFVSETTIGSIINGKYEDWGIEKNRLSPTLSQGIGALSEGTYQVTFTYVSNRGIESGSGVASPITVPSGSSISITIPTVLNNNIVAAKIYCSGPNGSELYFVKKINLGSTYSITSIPESSVIFRHFNLDAPPNGSILKYYKGRLYIVSGNLLFYSNPFQYHHFDMGYNYIEFSSDIVELLPVPEGIWVCTDKIDYLSGDTPDTFTKTTKEYVKAVKGTATRFSGSYIKIDNTPVGYKWLVTTDIGIFALFNNGLIINLTSDYLSLDKADSGTSLFLQSGGNNQYVSILKTNDKPNNSVMGDLVEAQIVRNGVIIQ